jgi:hypothetical protein
MLLSVRVASSCVCMRAGRHRRRTCWAHCCLPWKRRRALLAGERKGGPLLAAPHSTSRQPTHLQVGGPCGQLPLPVAQGAQGHHHQVWHGHTVLEGGVGNRGECFTRKGSGTASVQGAVRPPANAWAIGHTPRHPSRRSLHTTTCGGWSRHVHMGGGCMNDAVLLSSR